MKKYIIIGASAAGIAAAGKLRDLDKEAQITVIASQKNLPYNKCLLADYLLGSIPKERIFFKQQDFFDKNNIKLILATKVTKIDPKKNNIITDSGQEFDYDKLFLGLGTRPFVPQIPGIENITDIFTFQKLSDIHKISEFIKQNKVKSVAIIGTGLTGLECSDTLSCMGIKTYLVSRASQVMPKQIDKSGSKVLENLITKAGIIFEKNKKIKKASQKIKGNKKTFTLEFEDNTSLTVDMLLFVTGNKTNIEIAQEAGVKTLNKRILVNEFMQTNLENIYAGGDICVIKDILTGEHVPSCTWPDAAMQAMTAACNMAGQSKNYPGALITTSSKIFDTTFISCGPVINPPDNCKIIEKSNTDFYHKFIIKDNKLIGFLMVNNVDNVGKLKNMILKKEDFNENI